MPIQMVGKNLFAFADDLFFGHVGKTDLVPSILLAFNDHSRRAVIKLIGMHPNPTMFGFLKNKGKGIVEFLLGTQPDKFAFAHVNFRFEMLGIFLAHGAVDTVGGHDQIIVLAVFFG